MGQNFILTMIPAFKRTKERQRTLIELTELLEDGCTENGADKDYVIEAINNFFYKNFLLSGDIVEMKIEGCTYYFAGGSSWDDYSDTDPYTVIDTLNDLLESIGKEDLFLKWSKEDIKKKKRKK